jgi:inhibitor of cysteine peptidase
MRPLHKISVAIVIVLFITGCFALSAWALLNVASPDRVVSRATAIVTGRISSLETRNNVKTAQINVEQVLKGKVSRKTISLKVGAYMPGGKAPDVFPPKNTMVFIALAGSGNDWGLASDLNAVAIVEKGHVIKIYHGFNIGINQDHWIPKDYVQAYDAFYQSKKISNPAPGKEDKTAMVYGENQNGQTIRLVPGETVKLQLDSNPSTGYQWTIFGHPDQSMVAVQENDFQSASAQKKAVVGAGGVQSWTIKALKAGKTELTLWYCRPWESKIAERQCHLTIEVTAASR